MGLVLQESHEAQAPGGRDFLISFIVVSLLFCFYRKTQEYQRTAVRVTDISGAAFVSLSEKCQKISLLIWFLQAA